MGCVVAAQPLPLPLPLPLPMPMPPQSEQRYIADGDSGTHARSPAQIHARSPPVPSFVSTNYMHMIRQVWSDPPSRHHHPMRPGEMDGIQEGSDEYRLRQSYQRVTE